MSVKTKSPVAKKALQSRISEARCIVSDALIERDVEIDLAFCALIAQKHLLLVGPPGTAKSLIIETIGRFVEGAGKPFPVHCCKDTTRNAVFGPTKLSSLKKDLQERNLVGGAADSTFLILEEVFKAGPAVLDMFLMLLNERVYKEGLVQTKAPLKLAMAVSNEWSPEGCETALAAFFDRFLFRKEVSYVSKDAGRRRILQAACANNRCEAQFIDSISLKEIDQAHEEAMKLPISDDAKRAKWRILQELDKAGVSFSDRRLKESVGAERAYAYLQGGREVLPEHLKILGYILWDSPLEMPRKCEKICAKIATPVQSLIIEKLEEAEGVVASKINEADTYAKLDSIRKEIEVLKDCEEKEAAFERLAQLRQTKSDQRFLKS